MSQPKILITRRWPTVVEQAAAAEFDLHLNTNDQPMDQAAFQAALATYDAILPTVTDRIDATALANANPRTKILANYGVGYSHIDADAARALGLVVTNTPNVLSACTADIAMTLILMAARRAGEGERELRAGDWAGWRPTHLIGRKVTGARLGIIGFGRIGQEVARRAHHGFGMDILVQNRSPIAASVLAETKARQVADLASLLPECDFVSLHCPGGAENRGMIGAQEIAAMRDDAILINTARGEVVDENALIAALNAGRIGGAGLDVFDGEPAVNPGLMTAPNTVLLPHLGSATASTREAMGLRALDNLRAFFAGQEPPDRVI